jgi:uncharacterized protein YndB with AHSA1/START domain
MTCSLARRTLSLVLLFACALSTGHAETSAVSPGGFVVTFQREVDAPPERLWSAITRLPNWWSSAHTWSGKASNMHVDLQAGGCWCETWDGNSVMHGTVAYVQAGQVLRLYANLGPLQDRATVGVLTLAQGVVNGKTRLKVVYRVAGPVDVGLAELSKAVDEVLGDQVRRLATFAETGKVD